MPSQENRTGSQSGPVPVPGLKQWEPSVEPLGGGDGFTRPLPVAASQQKQVPSTDQLPAFAPQAGQMINTNLARVLTTTLPRVSEGSTSQRIPVVIKGSMKKAARAPLPPKAHRRRRLAVTLLGVLMLVLVTGLTLYSVTPLGHDMGMDWNPLAIRPGSTVVANQNSGLAKLVVQATATAVYHQQTDGMSGGNAQLVGNGAGSLNWPVGQCTFWANYRYHQLTGFWVPWSGNANQWVIGAQAAGWNVSTQPHVPSIIVLLGVQGANPTYGHVAVVENIVAGATPVTVHTSNMNWYADGGGWDIESYWNFTVGSGVYFVWHK